MGLKYKYCIIFDGQQNYEEIYEKRKRKKSTLKNFKE